MKKILIAFDLDGCLINLMAVFRRFLLEIHGVEIKSQKTFSLRSSTGLLSKDIWHLIHLSYKEVKSTPIFPGATKLLTKLYEKTNEPPMILTARPFDSVDDTYAVVKKLMKKTPFQLILKHPKASKGQYLRGYKFFLEDRRKTALELSDLGFTVPLIKKAYNHIPDIDSYPNIYYVDGVHTLIPDIDNFIS